VTRKQMIFLIGINALISALITLLLVVVILPRLDWQLLTVEQSTALASPGPQTTTPAEAGAVPSATPVVHTVSAGDTISGLALEYDVPEEDIIAANQLQNPDFLQVGTKLVIPVGGVQLATATLTPVPTNTNTPLPFEPPSVDMTATAGAAASATAAPLEPTESTRPVTGEVQVEITEVVAAGQAEEEQVVISNVGEQVADLQGWTLSDGQGNTYTFPNFRLWRDGSVTVHTRRGEDGSPVSSLYWGKLVAIWFPGKVVTLKDADDNLVSSYTVEP
jgi:LysM repeat protein